MSEKEIFKEIKPFYFINIHTHVKKRLYQLLLN